MYKLSRQFIPLINGPLRKRILSGTQPTLPFHLAASHAHTHIHTRTHHQCRQFD